MALAVALGGASAWVDVREARAESEGARPWLGVELEQARGDAKGVRVRRAVRSSPAWNAGVRDGDVILRVGEASPARPDDVIREVGTHAPGSSLRIMLLRAGNEVPVTATLGTMPDSDEMLRLDKIGQAAPAWKSLASVSGAPAALSELRGRVVVVDFWATWCTACRMAAPKLTAWQAKFGAQGLSVIGITDDPVPDAAQGAQSFGMRYAAIASDPSYGTQRAFGVRALPTIFVIDKRGVIRDVSVGYDPRRESEMEGLLVRLLAEPAN